MRNIILLCAAGMSTSMMVQRMQAAAKEIGYECKIEAHSVSEADQIKDIADIILLGPQVRFQLKKIQDICEGVTVKSINPADYGHMNGKNVLMHAKEVLGD